MPPKAPAKKTRRVQLLLRPDTWAAFQRLAEANGYSTNDYAERVLANLAHFNAAYLGPEETLAHALAHAVPDAEDSPKAKPEPVHTWELPDGLTPSHADLPEDAQAMLAGTLERVRAKCGDKPKAKRHK